MRLWAPDLAAMGASDHAAVVDQTVCDALSRAKIEDYYDIKLKDADPKALSFVVDQSKKAGNEAFRGGQYKGAWQRILAGPELCARDGRLGS